MRGRPLASPRWRDAHFSVRAECCWSIRQTLAWFDLRIVGRRWSCEFERMTLLLIITHGKPDFSPTVVLLPTVRPMRFSWSLAVRAPSWKIGLKLGHAFSPTTSKRTDMRLEPTKAPSRRRSSRASDISPGNRIVIVPILLTVSLPDPHLSIVPICCAPATHSVAWPLSCSRRRVRSGGKLPNDL